MALYGGLTPKRHIAFSNAKTIQILDLGKLLKEARQRLSKHGYQSTRSYNSNGRKVFSGTRFLKQTQMLGAILFSQQFDRALDTQKGLQMISLRSHIHSICKLSYLYIDMCFF